MLKTKDVFRIVLLNIGGLQQSGATQKNQDLLQFVNEKEADVIALTEVNVHWKLLPVAERLEERMKGWWGEGSPHLSYAYYKDFPDATPSQVGGTAIISIDSARSRAEAKGIDPKGLGRWCWTQYEGKGNLSVRVITAYRPCKNKENVTSTYEQQRLYYQRQGENPCPRTAMIDDLCKEIKKSMEKGEQIVLTLDANEDIRSGYARDKFTALNLIEINIHRHGNDAPATYNRGSKPIDGIFVSTTLIHSRCGYLAHGDTPTGCDHRALYIDLYTSAAFGNSIPTHKPSIRRMKCNDPRVVKRFNDVYSKFLSDHNLYDRSATLQEQAQHGPFTPAMAQEWEAIDSLRMEGTEKADKKCRKLKMGAVPWSPEIAKVRQKVKVWGLIKRRMTGCKVNGRFLRREMTKANIKFDQLQVTRAEAETRYLLSLKEFGARSKSAEQLRLTWLEQLANAQARHKRRPPRASVMRFRLRTSMTTPEMHLHLRHKKKIVSGLNLCTGS